MTPRRIIAAEAIGTFALVLAGTGAIVVNQATGALTHLGISLAFGIIVAAMIAAVGGISGAHLNPAVTVALIAARRTPASTLATHVPAQFTGALAASLVLHAAFPASQTLGATIPTVATTQAFAIEALITAFLAFVILAVSDPARRGMGSPAFIIGSTVALAALITGPLTGASMNPARSIAPAIVSGHHEQLWIYLVAPVVGSLVAVPAWAAIATPPNPTPSNPVPPVPTRP